MEYARNLKHWSELVLERDDYVCTECAAFGCRLHAHHIKERNKHPDMALSVHNGKTLCISCHIKYHPFMANFYGINPDIASDFIGVYKKDGVVKVKIDMDGYMKLVWQGAVELLNMLKRREKKKKKNKHGMCIGNWWMKQQGYRKDMRRDIWDILLESGQVLQYKESVYLFETVKKSKRRSKMFPASIITQFNTRAKEYYELLKEKAERIDGAKILLEEVQKDRPPLVIHPTFGEGIIIKRIGDKVRIKFTDGQVKVFNYEKAISIGLKEYKE